MQLEPYLRLQLTLVLEECRDWSDLFTRLAGAAASAMPGQNAEALAKRLRDREAQHSTATAEGVAFPHFLSSEFPQTTIVVARLPNRIRLSDRAPASCDLIFCMLGNADQPWMHVLMLARMARIVHTASVRERLRQCSTDQQLYDCLLREDRMHT